MFGGLPIGVVMVVILILVAAVYVFLNTPNIFEGEWRVIEKTDGVGTEYAEYLPVVTFSLSEDSGAVLMHRDDIEPIVFEILTLEPSTIIAEAKQANKLRLEFNVEDPNTNEISLVIKVFNGEDIVGTVNYGTG